MTLREILQIEHWPFARELRHAIEMADRLHRCPNVPPVPVTLSRRRLEQGAYHSLSRPSRPVKIEISIHATLPALTLLHEIGHLLDHMALNPLKHGFGSDCDPSFQHLWKLWSKSRSVRRLKALCDRKRPVLEPSVRRYLLYQARESELWARTYVQWVVVRSDDMLLAREFCLARSECAEYGGDSYWDEDDFGGIIEAVDELFRNAGLV